MKTIKIIRLSKDNQIKIKEKGKKYREENKHKLKEFFKIYNEKNKDTINAKRNQEMICECGGHYTLRHKARHFKTIKHIKFIDQQNI